MGAGTPNADQRVEEIACDLCILGAGISGLNALFVASRYLSRNQKVVLVDRRAGVGGMWASAYGYVRLHQPHPLFTAGNIAWTTHESPSHLATRGEVLSHFGHCLDTLRRRVTLDERYGYEYEGHDESSAPDEVLVCCRSTVDGSPLRIKAKKFVKALGHDVKVKAPLALSSKQVRSLSPDSDDLFSGEVSASTAPVYVVGGGKTAMDTAHALIAHFPGRPVDLLIGSGTMFACRDDVFPTGPRRYFGGTTPLTAFLDIGRRFDGTNEQAVLDHFRRKYAVSLVPDARRYLFGLLSNRENAAIAAGAREVIKDYLDDVVDRDGRPTLILRSGASRPIEPGSFLVNCTGYLIRGDIPYEPFVSPSGNVISIQSSSSLHIFTTVAAYFAVHLAYLNLLRQLPLYELDLVALQRIGGEVLGPAIGVHALYNLGLIFTGAPRRVFDEFGIDLERWYPAPRRLLDGISFLRFQKRHPDHFRRALDKVHERFGVRCGPLRHDGGVSGSN